MYEGILFTGADLFRGCGPLDSKCAHHPAVSGAPCPSEQLYTSNAACACTDIAKGQHCNTALHMFFATFHVPANGQESLSLSLALLRR